MKQPIINGRKAPKQDWEGDDFTPGAHGAFVTCTDTSAGRMVAYATNGRVDKDGKEYRAAIPGDPNGITLQQADVAIHRVAGRDLVIPGAWTWKQVLAHLTAAKGLIVQGWYSEIPRAYRYQPGADFGHAMWVSHYSPTSGMRVWDPLNPDTTGYGRWVPAPVIREFMQELSRRNGTTALYCGYVPLEHL